MYKESEESQYLTNIIAHISWHQQQRKGTQSEEDLTEDLSCIDCYPVTEEITIEFTHFWSHCIQTKDQDSTYSSKTIEIFERIRAGGIGRTSKLLNLLTQLLKTIRFSKVPTFATTVENLHFYWSATEKFNNWTPYFSDYSESVSDLTSELSETIRSEELGNMSEKKELVFGEEDFSVNNEIRLTKDQENRRDPSTLGSSVKQRDNEEGDGYERIIIRES